MTLRMIQGEKPPQLGGSEYIWADALGDLHYRFRPVEVYEDVPRIEHWTGRFPTTGEEILLRPAHYLPDPFRGQPCYLVLCEVKDPQDMPHETNTRAALRELLYGENRLHFNKGDFPELAFEAQYHQQTDNPSGYRMAEKHIGACVDSGLLLHSATAYDEAPAWAYRIGARSVGTDPGDPQELLLTVCDHLWLARAFLEKAGREQGLNPTSLPGRAFIHGHPEDLVVLTEGLRTHWVAHMTLEGIAIELKPHFDPYVVATRLLSNLYTLRTTP